LFKCIFWLGLVLWAIDWPRQEKISPPNGSPVNVSRENARAAPLAEAPVAKKSVAVPPGDALSALSRAAADQLTAAARRHCLERPRDCLEAIETLRNGASPRPPSSR
jgi:hypothetical protein